MEKTMPQEAENQDIELELPEGEGDVPAVEVVEETEMETVRARNKKGRYLADDKSTPDVNEAYVKRKKKK